jgi:hypothetical protein
MKRGGMMAEKVAEYFGVDVNKTIPLAVNSLGKPAIPCPFRNGDCLKLAKGQVPVCSVRSPKNGSLWIVCEHRLCASTPKTSALTAYQIGILKHIIETVEPNLPPDIHPVVQREGKIRRNPGKSNSDDSKADFLVHFVSDAGKVDPRFRPIVLEMQGGGETSNTKSMSNHVREWELGKPGVQIDSAISNVGSIETNAWRRQQEQFLFKGSVATKSNARLVFAVGARLYDKLMSNLTAAPSAIPSAGGWTLAILAFDEVKPGQRGIGTAGSIELSIDQSKTLFTDFGSFSRALTDQGSFDPELFQGEFRRLDNVVVILKP